MGPSQISDTPFQGYVIHISDTQIGRWFLSIIYINM